jgi:hypothetical protein
LRVPPLQGAGHNAPCAGVVPLLLAGLALLAAWWGMQQAPTADVRVGARLFAPGESYGGDPLGADHPPARRAGTRWSRRSIRAA